MVVEQTKSQANKDLIFKKKYLNRYKNTISCIKRLESKLESLNLRISSCSGGSFDNEIHSTIIYTRVDMICDRVDLEHRIERLKEKAKSYKQDVYDAIDMIERPLYVEVLELIYIDCLTLEQTSFEKRYSLSRIKSIYRSALDSIDINHIRQRLDASNDL